MGEKQDNLLLYYVTEKNFALVTWPKKQPYLWFQGYPWNSYILLFFFIFVCFQNRFECVWARKLNCSAICHRAVGEYLYNLHDNNFIFERSYLLTDVHFWGSLRCECRKLVPMVCRPGWVCHVTLQQTFHILSSLNGRLGGSAVPSFIQ